MRQHRNPGLDGERASDMSNITHTAVLAEGERRSSQAVEFDDSDQHVKVWATEVNDGDPADPLRMVELYLEDMGSVRQEPTTIVSGTFRLESDGARRLGELLIQHADMVARGLVQ